MVPGKFVGHPCSVHPWGVEKLGGQGHLEECQFGVLKLHVTLAGGQPEWESFLWIGLMA